MNFRVPIRACLYALDKNSRLPEKIENLIYTCPASSYLYSKYILKTRIPIEFENIFSKGFCFKQNYRAYEIKKMISKEEIKIEQFNFFNKIFKQYTISGISRINFLINFESDSPVIKNNYISLAYLYARDIIKGRLPIDIEEAAFINQPISCYLYFKDVIKKDCPKHLEQIIQKESAVLLSYSQIKNNLEELEVLLEPEHALVYSKEISKSRFSKQHEEIIFSKNLIFASEYAISVLNDRLDENLHNMIILKSLEPNCNANIKKYLFFIYNLELMYKFWNDFLSKIEKVKQKFFHVFDFEINKKENFIKINEDIIVNLKKPCGDKLSRISISSINNSNDTSKIHLPVEFEIQQNYEDVMNNALSYCCYQILKNKMSNII